MEELDILLQNVLTLNKMIMMREKPQNSKKGKTGNKKKSYEKKKIVYTMEDSEDAYTMKMKKQRLYLWV